MKLGCIALASTLLMVGHLAIPHAAHSAREPDSPLPQTGQWSPSEAQKVQVEQLTHKYFSAKDEARYQDAYAMQTDGMHNLASFGEWTRSIKDFSNTAGKVVSRQIKKITWYKDPPNAPARGVYAAVDFTSRFENIDTYCGYLVWFQQPDGTFKMAREEVSYIDKKTQERLDEKTLAQLKASIRCQ